MCYPGGGTADGKAGDHVLLAPPFIYQQSHIEELVDKLARAIDAALAEVAPQEAAQ
jgi:adenosylmethionine-8-amino-7-oxononanoate aminotransferase